MAKKKVTKKAVMKKTPTCSAKDCSYNGILALAIIVLTWWKPTETWSQITITVAAAMILLSTHNHICKK